MNEQEYIWNECEVEGFFLPNKNMVMSLAFYFDKGRALIYKVDNKQWAFAVEKRNIVEINEENRDAYIPLSTKKFPVLLNEITARKETEFKSMLNVAGISNRNAGEIIGQMAGKMLEHLAEINVETKEFDDAVPFFKSVDKPRWVNIMDNMKKIQYIEDDAPYVVDCATFLGSKIIDDNPIHTLDVGPPSSGKTQFIKMMSPGMRPNKYVHPLSDLTSKSMVSGLEGNEDLYPMLDKKLVTMEEFTIMIAKDPTERGAILGQIRAMYGGHYSKTFGSGVGTKSYDATFGLLAGCTSLIDTLAHEMAIAGERFIKIRRRHNINSRIHERIVDAAYDDVVHDPTIGISIQDELFSLYESFDTTKMPKIPDHIAPYIKHCANITAFLRVAVVRDKFSKGKDMQSEPTIEVAGRLVKVYKKLAMIITWMLGKTEADVEVVSYIYRVAMDTPITNRTSILKVLNFETKQESIDVICDKVRLPKNTVRLIMEDLRISDIVLKGEIELVAATENTEAITKDSFYLNKDSLLFEYLMHVEIFLAQLEGEEIHHNIMSADFKWTDVYFEELMINKPTGPDVECVPEHDETDHIIVHNTDHLTVDDHDPDWNPEPELEDVDEPKAPFEVPEDPNADIEDEEHNDPNA